MSGAIHAVHAVLAGVWLGGVIFTTAVVSPALRAMKWSEPERVMVRSKIGERYAKVGSANLALLALFALLDGFVAGLGAALYAEYALLAVLVALVVAHGAYFGPKLRELAEQPTGSDEEVRVQRRRELQRVSLRVSWANLLVSLAVAALAAGF